MIVSINSSGGYGCILESDEVAHVIGDQRLELRLQLRRIQLPHALVLAGDHDVDAVGLVADVLVDPLELDLELLGREADGAEHAEATGLGHRGDDVAAVREGEDRELDAETFTELGVHGALRCVGVAPNLE